MIKSEAMCFSIPCKVLVVKGDFAFVEGWKKVILGKEIKVKRGEYLQVVGNVAIGKITKEDGVKIRKLIRSLNDYGQN